MKLSKNGHVVETSLPREAVRLQSEGYAPVSDAPTINLDDLASELGLAPIESPKPSPKPSK